MIRLAIEAPSSLYLFRTRNDLGVIFRSLPGENFSDLARIGGRIVGGWVFGEQVFKKSGFGGFWWFDWFGFGFAQMRRARFAGFADSWGELQIERDWEREKAAEGPEDLAGELRGMGY